jgi:hypothetical protein
MSEVPFHVTRAGTRFLEDTVPSLVSAIERLAAAMERIADSQARVGSHQPLQENVDEPEGRRTEDPQPPNL